MALLLQILVDTTHIPHRQLLRVLPLQLNLPLHLTDIAQQVLQLRGLIRQEGEIPSGTRNEPQVQREQGQRARTSTRGRGGSQQRMGRAQRVGSMAQDRALLRAAHGTSDLERADLEAIEDPQMDCAVVRADQQDVHGVTGAFRRGMEYRVDGRAGTKHVIPDVSELATGRPVRRVGIVHLLASGRW